MKADATITAFIEIKAAGQQDSLSRSKRRWQRSLLLYLISSVFTSTLGLVLSIGGLLHMIPTDGPLSTASSILLAISFPLLVMTAHCLDRMTDINRSIRIKALRQKSLKHFQT